MLQRPTELHCLLIRVPTFFARTAWRQTTDRVDDVVSACKDAVVMIDQDLVQVLNQGGIPTA